MVETRLRKLPRKPNEPSDASAQAMRLVPPRLSIEATNSKESGNA